MNTKIGYLYRDADNYKIWNEAVVAGSMTAEQKQIIAGCLKDGEYFIPSAVALPEVTFVNFGFSYNEQSDGPFFELSIDDIYETQAAPTVAHLTVTGLVEKFQQAKGKWDELASATENCRMEVSSV